MRPKPRAFRSREVLNDSRLLPGDLLFDWRPFSQFMKNSPQMLSARFWTGLLLLIFCLRAEGQQWVSHANTGSGERFLFASRVADYNFSSDTWSTAATLPRTGATAIAQDANGIYVAYGTSIYQYSTAFAGETLVGSAANSVHGLFLDGNLLIAVHSAGLYYNVSIYSRATRALLGSNSTYVDSLFGAAHAPGLNKLFGSTSGISPADVVMAAYTDAGIPSAASDSPYHGTYSIGAKNWIAPGELRLINSAGIVYSSSSLTYLTSLGGSLQDVAFNGDLPIVIRGTELVSFANTYLEAGKKTVSGTAVAVSGANSYVFAQTVGNPTVAVIPLADIQAPQPGQPVNPTGLAYTPDAVFMDRDDNVLLFSKAQLSLFRWSTSQRRYLTTLPLAGVPEYAAYSRENHTAYFAYAGGLIRKMDLSAANPVETPFYTLPRTATGLATAGSIVAASDPSGAWHTHYYILPNGTLGSSAEWNYYSREWTWDPVMRRMYFFRDDTSPNDLQYEVISATGQITSAGETPYHGDFSVVPPIRVSPDGQRVLLGSGVTFVTSTLTLTGTTLPALADAAWSSTKLYAALSGTNQTTLRTFHPSTFATIGTLPALTGTPVRVLNLPSEQLMTVTLDAGKPRFHILNSTDTVTFDSIRDNTAPVLTGFIVQTKMGQAIDVSAAKIVVRATDAEGDSIALTAVTAATLRGGAATLASGVIHYIPPAAFSGTDEVTLTLTDSRGKSGPSILQIQVLAEPMQTNPPRLTTMPGGQMNILWQGIPGRTYTLQRSPDLSSWTTLGSVVPDAQGAVSFTDNPGIPSAFYRIVAP